MKIIRGILILLIALSPVLMTAQQAPEGQFKKHITYLASDELGGRETGTDGARLAAEYISSTMKAYGISPAGDSADWYLPFMFTDGYYFGEENRFQINGADQSFGDEWFTTAVSGNGAVDGMGLDVGYGIHAPSIDFDDYKGKDDALNNKILIMRLGSPESENPHSKYAPYESMQDKVDAAEKKGAVAVIFIEGHPDAAKPNPHLDRRISRAGIPVAYVPGIEASGLLNKKLRLVTEILPQRTQGVNVVGEIDRGADKWIVIGAHYDHLGMGHDGSLHRGEPAIHNGADDNASGIALMLEIAKELKQRSPKYNYRFMAFSGEEKGLLGSKAYVEREDFAPGEVAAMINFDMVGRLDPEENILGLNGVGSSPAWNEIIENLPEFNDGNGNKLGYKTTESGVGPSDQTSFYLKDIPVIHFFSGTHSDYHKPSDDEHLINYPGMGMIYHMCMAVIKDLDARTEIPFTKTKEETTDAPRFTVTLGVIPDYMYEGRGMRIDGVTDGKPAANAKMKTGDVVVKMGDFEVRDMMSYMKALSMFKKGDTVKVEYMRGKKTKKTKVTF